MSDEQTSRNLRLPDVEISPVGHHAYYQKSWALVIGINDYEGRPLKNARNDAEAVAALLKEKYGFDEVISLLDKDASRENILRYLREDLRDRVGDEDRLIIFFAGHGESQPRKGGGRIGYIIPQDARKDTSIDHIDMDELRKACDRIPAKHILIILDCCFSGVAAITTGLRGKTDEKPPKKLNDLYLRKLTEKKAYQIMTAGDVDQSIRDSGCVPGHSAFTAALLDGLRGDADRDSNGLITATELFDYVQPRVSCETSADGAEGQMPFLDYIRGSDIYHPGNFVFMLPSIVVDKGDEKKKSNNKGYPTAGQNGNPYLRLIIKNWPLISIIFLILSALFIKGFIPINWYQNSHEENKSIDKESESLINIIGTIIYNNEAISEYSNAYAEISLEDDETGRLLPVNFSYDRENGNFVIRDVPPGKYSASVTVQSGYPFDMDDDWASNAGDFVSFLSELNNTIIVPPHVEEVHKDLYVVYCIHLIEPVDNQELRTYTYDPPEELYRSFYYPSADKFEWEPVPGASSYSIYILENSSSSIVVDERIRSNRFSPHLDVNAGDEYYEFTLQAYGSEGNLIGIFDNFYKNGRGGWFNFKVIPDPE